MRNHPGAGRQGPVRSSGFVAAVQLTRPRNCLLTAISVWVGAVTSGGPHATAAVVFAAAGAAAIAAAGNGMNDVIDLQTDRLNRATRPLPSGRLSAGVALALSSLLGVTGLALAFLAGLLPGMIAFAVVVGLALYNWFLKRVGLAGNLLVSLIAATTFPYGAAAAGGWGRWWIPALFAVGYHLARELVKGVEDTEGDRLAGVRTVARIYGDHRACRSAAVLLALVGLAAPLPVLLDIYGLAYLALVGLLDVFLASIVLSLWSGNPGGRRLSPRLLLGMALGLVAIVLGEILARPH
ncbi:MAG: MFS transporter [Gemmatimonadaceae bacterium]|nr:MFS transporter [Gemmatimonadaceae bacterium]